ncbi:MAG: DUF5412 family protein [Bacilli bacterium]|nr:DUF5412 family protein [Bacilli bacterium]
MIVKIKKYKWLIIIFAIVLIVIGAIYYFDNSMNYLPKGEYLYSVEAPDKKFKVNAYFIDGGPISGDAIRVELVNTVNDNTKNIYWKYPISTVDIKWIDNETVVINDIKLNIYTDIYKYKR